MNTSQRGPAYARALFEELGKDGPSPSLRSVASALRLEVREVAAEGFDGALVRAKDLPLGQIVVRESIREASRKNFTIAHEIGHFVLPGHADEDLVCTASDIANWGQRAKALEREADEFASELLMPASIVEPIARSAPPSLKIIEQIATESRASLSAAAWRYCDLSAERCAIVWSKQGRIEWSKRSAGFGFFLPKGAWIRAGTLAFDCFAGMKRTSEPRPVNAGLWIPSRDLPPGSRIWEQSKPLPTYQSVISLLWNRERSER